MSGRALFPESPFVGHALALVAGAMLPLSLAPFNFWWSGIVSILLLLSVLQSTELKSALIRWGLFGLGQYLLGASWIYVSINTHGGASPLLAATLVFLFALLNASLVLAQGFIYEKWFRQARFRVLLVFPALWLIKEWSTTWVLTGFPWALMGYGQIDTPLAGYAPVVGVLGIGLATVFVGSALFLAVTHAGRQRLNYGLLAVVPWLIGFALTFIEYTKPVGEPLKVSLIQGNIDQQTKWQRASIQPIINRYVGLSSTEWGRDLVLWPEAAITLFKQDAEPLLDELGQAIAPGGTTLVLGLPDRDQTSYFNSVVAIGAGSGAYRKQHLVPFGEFVPFEDLLRGLIEFFDLPMSHNRPGAKDQPLLSVGELKLGLSICYEVAFPDLVRQQAAESSLLATISNDTWFGRSIGPHQHMQMAQMRALENQRYLIRSTNNGITAAVDQNGQIINRIPQFKQGVLRSTVQPVSGATPYTVLGDWPLLLGLFGVLLWFRRRIDSDRVDAQ